jgi:hypothetical protein
MARCEDAPCCGCCSFAELYAQPEPDPDEFYDDFDPDDEDVQAWLPATRDPTSARFY